MLPASPLAAHQADHQALLEFLDLCPAGVLRTDGDGVIATMNPHAAQLLLPLATRTGGGLRNLFALLDPCAPELRALAASFPAPRGTVCDNHRITLRPARDSEAEAAAGPRVLCCTLVKLGPDCLMALLTDATRQVDAETRLRQTESWFAALMVGVNDFALFTLDRAGHIDGWNRSGQHLTGFTESDLLGRTTQHLFHEDERRPGRDVEHLHAARQEGWHMEEGWCARRGGTRFWGQVLVAAVEGADGAVTGFSAVLRDITERRMSAEELRRLLTTDHLTGANNRAHFFEVAGRELARWRRHRQPLSVLMLDLDHFKQVNDTLGHDAGDRVLRTLVAACRPQLRNTDLLARLGGEEFAVLLPDTALPGAVETADRLRLAIAQALAVLDGQPLGVTASLGCATATDGADTPDALLRLADRALYRAKHAGRNCVEVEPPPT